MTEEKLSLTERMKRDAPMYEHKLMMQKNLSECIVRFGGLHSWYKYGTKKVTVYMFPVVGGPQEPKHYEGTTSIQPSEVYWHLSTEQRGDAFTDFEDCHPDIRTVVNNHPVHSSEMYFTTPNFFWQFGHHIKDRDPSNEKQTEAINQNVFKMCVDFASDFVRFQPFYDECFKQANLIIDELWVAYPTTPLPRGVTKMHVLPEAEQ